jgi:hypothetical protein
MRIRDSLKLLGFSLVLACAGCAHSIAIAPDQAVLASGQAEAKIDKRVGYFISAENRAKKAATPAGGGDRVRYAPYADLEAGLHRVLSNVFSQVSVIKDIKDTTFIREGDINLVFVPTIETDSSSRNHFFWPPTDFSVSIDCLALDGDGREIWRKTVKADGGLIPVSQILKERGLAGRRAAENALKQLQEELAKAPELRR